jgi:hypothetical protein
MSEEKLRETLNLPAVQQKEPAPVPIVGGQLAPTDLDGLWRLATIMCDSGMVPDIYRGQPAKVFVACSWGMEIGLSFNNSLQAIAVIDGKPAIYGDAGLALVRGSGKLEDIHEYFEGEFGKDDYRAVCKVKRAGEERVHEFEFSVLDARLMGKWDKPTRQNKPSVWQKYPKRMLRWRARWFALRDVFGDVLKGIGIFEEIQDSIEMEPDEAGKYVQKNVTADNSRELEPEPVVDAEFEAKAEPTDDDYVGTSIEGESPAELKQAGAVVEDVDISQPDEVLSLADQFYQIIGIDNKAAGDAFVEKACEINGCPADKIYEDAIAKPDVFKGLVDKWIQKTGAKVQDTPQVTSTPDPAEDMTPLQEMYSMAAAYYGQEVTAGAQQLMDNYVDYIVELAGHTHAQILANLKSSPGEWFQYYEGWAEQNKQKAADKKEEAPAAPETPSEAPGEEISKDAAADMQSTLMKADEISWPAWKIKWNTMKPQDYEGAVWSQLDKFSAAETEAPAIAKRARAKWGDFYPDKVYPVDAKREEVSNSGGEEATDDVEKRWAFILENYPESVTKALDKRKMAKSGLSQQAKAIIIQDVFEMNS